LKAGALLGWFVGISNQQNIDALLESIGFQYSRAGTEFAHPNLLFVPDWNLRIAKWIPETDYSGSDIDRVFKSCQARAIGSVGIPSGCTRCCCLRVRYSASQWFIA
jgi:hypothetical protein